MLRVAFGAFALVSAAKSACITEITKRIIPQRLKPYATPTITHTKDDKQMMNS